MTWTLKFPLIASVGMVSWSQLVPDLSVLKVFGVPLLVRFSFQA